MEHEEMLRETYRLAQDNNRMLRSMRRNAFWGSLFRLIIYAAILLVPVWFYFTYLAPVVAEMMQTVEQIRGTGAQAQAQFSSFQELLHKAQGMLGGGQ
jgi:galactitol-specific phosphotransferase system IIC component